MHIRAARTTRHAQRSLPTAALFICAALSPSLQPAAAQSCTPQWQPFAPFNTTLPGADRSVTDSILWDPDGPGPATTKLVIVGSFTAIADTTALRIAVYDFDTQTWSPLGAGFNNNAEELAILNDGSLIAAGRFTASGATTVNRIARWDGAQWQPLSTGLSGNVWTLLVHPNGDLIVGGAFDTAGGIAARNVARWNGAQWSSFGSGLGINSSQYEVDALALVQGELIAGGNFTFPPSGILRGIARWNGAGWTSIAGADTRIEGVVRDILPLPSGGFLAAGSFSKAIHDGQTRTMRNITVWNGAEWTPLGPGLGNASRLIPGFISSVTPLSDGRLLAGGAFRTDLGAPANAIALWDGASWSPLNTSMTGSSEPLVYTMLPLPNGKVFVGGNYKSVSGLGAANAAFLDLNSLDWQSLGTGFTDHVTTLASFPNGDLLAAGEFTHAAGVRLTRIGRWNGATWLPYGEGFDKLVRAVAIGPQDAVYAGGSFFASGSQPVTRVARWNGAAWAPMGEGFNNEVNALLALPNGDLIAAGVFTASFSGATPLSRIARWNGSSWSQMGAGLNFEVYALARMNDGSIIAGGAFSGSGATTARAIARWDGSQWLPLASGLTFPSGLPTVNALKALPDGRLLVGGQFATAGAVLASNIAVWNGAAWSALGLGVNDEVLAVAATDNADIYAAGDFTTAGGAPAQRIARWDGAAWSPVTPVPVGGFNDGIAALHAVSPNTLLVAGNFTTAGSLIIPYLARLACPPLTGDADGNGVVNFVDLNLVLSSLGQPVTPGSHGDLNNDGRVDFADLNTLLSSLGQAR